MDIKIKSNFRFTVAAIEYNARGYYAASGVKEKTRDCYRLMCRHLEAYGDKANLQGF